ncbi:MAG: hypothetical protein IH991_00200 [Planctomycetes bacterium]|nr:hypothetical protein [Planctomycetota bacterium]
MLDGSSTSESEEPVLLQDGGTPVRELIAATDRGLFKTKGAVGTTTAGGKDARQEVGGSLPDGAFVRPFDADAAFPVRRIEHQRRTPCALGSTRMPDSEPPGL